MTRQEVLLMLQKYRLAGQDVFRVERNENEWKDANVVRNKIEDGFLLYCLYLNTIVNGTITKTKHSSFEDVLEAANQFMEDFEE